MNKLRRIVVQTPDNSIMLRRIEKIQIDLNAEQKNLVVCEMARVKDTTFIGVKEEGKEKRKNA